MGRHRIDVNIEMDLIGQVMDWIHDWRKIRTIVRLFGFSKM
jgi:hypothetical protein